MNWTKNLSKRDYFFLALVSVLLIIGLGIISSALVTPQGGGMATALAIVFLIVVLFFILAIYLAVDTFSPSTTTKNSSKVGRTFSIIVLGLSLLQLVASFFRPVWWNPFGIFILGVICALWIRGVDSFINSIQRTESSRSKIFSTLLLSFVLGVPIIVAIFIYSPLNF